MGVFRLKLGVLFSLAVATFALEHPAGAKIIGIDDREILKAEDYPWAKSLGRLTVFHNWGNLNCTAILTGKKRIQTAAHCLIDPITLLPLNHYRAVFCPAFPQPSTRCSEIREVLSPSEDPIFRDPNFDSAQAEIEDELGRAEHLGHVPLASLSVGELVRSLRRVVLPGLSLEKSKFLKHAGCSLTGFTDRGLYWHNCDTGKGASGAPILVELKQGWRVVALHVRGHLRKQKTKRIQNRAVSLFNWIRRSEDDREKDI